MNIKILQHFINLEGKGATPELFYKFVEENYPEEIERLNMEVVRRML